MEFHLIGATVGMADGGGTFIVIRPIAAGIFQPGTKWRAVGQTNAAVYKTSRRFKASRLSSAPEEADNGGVISALRVELETFAFVSGTNL